MSCPDFCVNGSPRPRKRKPAPAPATAPDTGFVALWQGLIGALSALAADYDRRWQKRRRVLNTLLVMLFVFRLVFAPRRQGYTTTLAQLWAQCRALDVPLPQPQPVSDAAMCKARPKLDENVFKQFQAEILRRAERPGPRWQGHRVFAVDGSKLNLPRPLVNAGYATPGPKAHYPQGLCSAACSAFYIGESEPESESQSRTPTTASRRWPTCRPWRPPTSSSTTAATTPSNCCAPTTSAACTRCSASSARRARPSTASSPAASATRW